MLIIFPFLGTFYDYEFSIFDLSKICVKRNFYSFLLANGKQDLTGEYDLVLPSIFIYLCDEMQNVIK